MMDDDLSGALGGIIERVEAAIKSAVRRATLKISGDAKALCPVETGRLRNSIVTDLLDDDGDIVGTVGTNLDYAPFPEFGTGPKGDPSVPHTSKESWVYKDPKTSEFKRSYGQPPQPFLYPAFKQNMGAVKAMIAAEVKKAISGD